MEKAGVWPCPSKMRLVLESFGGNPLVREELEFFSRSQSNERIAI
jgi:hypothetical protein